MNRSQPTDTITPPSRWNLNQQLQRMPLEERHKLIKILVQLDRIDESLGELHLTLPTIKVWFYGLPLGSPTLYSARELLKLVHQSMDRY